jgi:iron complex outermembrane receptor protein
MVGAANVNTNLSGNKPPQSPGMTISMGYDHIFNIGDSEVKASVFGRLKSEYYLTAFNDRADRRGTYSQTDLSLEYRAPGKAWTLRGFVRNLEDERVKVSSNFTGGTVGIYSWQRGTPRTYGAQFSYKF